MDPVYLSEDELDSRYQTKSQLESGGDYGCGCLVYEGDVEAEGDWLDDHHFGELQRGVPHDELKKRWGHADIGTVVVTGNLAVRGSLNITDRLTCLVVLGDLNAGELATRETEVFVAGNATVRSLAGDREYLTVGGTLSTSET